MKKDILTAAAICAVRVTNRVLDKTDLGAFKPKTEDDRAFQKEHLLNNVVRIMKTKQGV
jgi:hypothetical protein